MNNSKKFIEMHFLLSYEIRETSPKKTTVEQRINSILAPYRHVQALSTATVVKVDNAAQWAGIMRQCSALSPEFNVSFLSSPLINGASYNGLLYPNLWTEINSLTQ